MLRERWISMEAIDRRANVFRSWRCEVGTDLLGSVVLSVTFGRTATAGRTITRAVTDEAAATRPVRQLLRRRATAERRIGVAYRVVGGEGFSDLVGGSRADPGALTPSCSAKGPRSLPRMSPTA